MRELRDELEVPGHVVMHKVMTFEEKKKRANELISKWQAAGHVKPDDVPESEEKDELRNLMRSLGLKVRF